MSHRGKSTNLLKWTISDISTVQTQRKAKWSQRPRWLSRCFDVELYFVGCLGRLYVNVECLAVTAFPQADPQNVTTGTHVLRPIAGRGVEKWIARLWNVREESGSEWLVVEVSSVIDIASGLLARVKVKSFDFDHNLHCALAEREGHSGEPVHGHSV